MLVRVGQRHPEALRDRRKGRSLESPTSSATAGASAANRSWVHARGISWPSRSCGRAPRPSVPPRRAAAARHGRRQRERVAQQRVADARSNHRCCQQRGDVAQPTRGKAAAARVQAVDQVKQRAGPVGLAVGNGGSGEQEPEGAFDQRHGHRADTGERNDAPEPSRAVLARCPRRRDHDDGQDDRRQALDQQVLRHRHNLVPGVRRDQLGAGGGHIQIRRPNRQARHPRHGKADAPPRPAR